MSLQTPWGYTLTEVEALPELLLPSDFNQMTNGRYSQDSRVTPAIASATDAVRAYVGWHLGPDLACEAVFDSIATGRILQLPARYVSGIQSVTVGDRELTENDWALKTNGLLVLRRRPCRDDWNDITVRYTAGLPVNLLSAVRDLIASRVTHGLAQSYGVQSEATGGVSITYNATWANSAQASMLPETAREILAPYKLMGVH